MVTCPACGHTFEQQTYDTGSGPELSCPRCETCWGADGQDLKPLDMTATRAMLAQHLPANHWALRPPTFRLET